MTESIGFMLWRTTAGAPSLDEGDLHLWRIEAGPVGTDPDRLWPLLCPAEQERARRFATQTLRDRYVRAHATLRLILGIYLNEPPEEIVFKISERGKPRLDRGVEHEMNGGVCTAPPRKTRDRLEFNLTGSHDLALVAISLDHPVGVDCERIRPCRELLAIAQRMFPPQVADTLAQTPEPQRLDAFYAAWTELEARVKADGRGLFGARDPAALPLATAHCTPRAGYLAAVARYRLPPIQAWRRFEWFHAA